MQKKGKEKHRIEMFINEYKNKDEFSDQIFGNLGAVIKGLFRSINRFPSAL